MADTLNDTPSGVRTHIGFFGRMNAGKSALINALAGQEVSIVSPQEGTTTDTVKKTMEIHGLGPCVLLDTAGFDDPTMVGEKRVAASRRAADKTDIAVILLSPRQEGDGLFVMEREWASRFRREGVNCIAVLSRDDERTEAETLSLREAARRETGLDPIPVSAVTGRGIRDLMEALVGLRERLPEKKRILGDLVREGDAVLLVMPQDPQAPEGRLILPQVQTIREALDRHCMVLGVQTAQLPMALEALKRPPALVVTDSQVFDAVAEAIPADVPLTSFSVLFAALKGDMDIYLKGAAALGGLGPDSAVLIAECCTHAPLEEDIGRVKIPAMLRRRFGPGLRVDITAGDDFPEDVSGYDLIIQCGACMLNRRRVMSRLLQAEEKQVPITNYGIAIAYLRGILPRIALP